MKYSRPGVACALVLLWALGCVLPAAAGATEIIVRREAGLTGAERAELRADAGVKLERTLRLKDAELVTVPEHRADRALQALNQDPDVVVATANRPVRLASAPTPLTNDPYSYLQWSLRQDNDADIDADIAWAHFGDDVVPGEGVKVAVVDQRVDRTHLDLQDTLDPEVNVLPDALACPAPDPTGTADHATHIAGTIAARPNNNISIAGIAPGARVLPVRAFDNCGGSSLAIVLEGFRRAAEAGAAVAVGSFATDPLDQSDAAGMNRLFAELFRDYAGTLFVVAAGNEGSDNSDRSRPVYPCDTRGAEDVDVPNLVCVGMTDATDAPSCQGNIGPEVDVFAPGVQVFSTVGGGPAFGRNAVALSGTSVSAAVVAGVATLALSAQPPENPPLGAAELKDILVNAVDGGRINAAKAVGAPLPPGDKGGGPGLTATWKSCDQDHDGFTDSQDKCPYVVGPYEGCPDSDGDGRHDGADNCPLVANDQADMDGDGIGDACDPDVDGDMLAEAQDDCPRVRAFTANGCPPGEPPTGGQGPGNPPVSNPPTITPTATPTPVPPRSTASMFTAFTAKANRCKAGKRCKRAAKVTIALSRTAKVALTLDRRVGKKWRRYSKRTVTVTTATKRVTLRGKRGRTLAKGSYRVIAAISGGVRGTATFRVA